MREGAFGVTAKIGEGEFDLYVVLINLLQDKLNQYLNIKDYSTSLRLILIIYVSHGMSPRLHPNSISYSKKKQSLVLQYRLKGDKMLEKSQSQNLQTLTLAYLEALKEAKEKKRIKDFDFDKFRTDVAELFEAEGWLMKEAA